MQVTLLTVEENTSIFSLSNRYALIAVSKGMWEVKVCSKKSSSS